LLLSLITSSVSYSVIMYHIYSSYVVHSVYKCILTSFCLPLPLWGRHNVVVLSILLSVWWYIQDCQENFWAPGQKETCPPPPILQVKIFKLSPPQCVISKESVKKKKIDELWFRKQLSTCLFVWTLNYNDLVHLLIDVFL
jgi:hypothetical protein